MELHYQAGAQVCESNMEPVLNLDPVAQWFRKYLLPSEQIPEMAACTSLSPLAEPFVPRDPDGVFWPGQLLSDSSCLDWSNDAQVLHVHIGGQVNVDTQGREATNGPPAIRPIGYERAQKREQQKAETPGLELLGDTSGIDENFDVGVEGKSYSCEITAAFLEGLQGGAATLREGGFCPGQYTRFSGVTLWDKLTSDRSCNVECTPCSTDTDTIDSSYSAGLSSDTSDCAGSSDDTQDTSNAVCSNIEWRASSPGLDIACEWPHQDDVANFTYPLTSLDLLIVKDRAGAMRSLQKDSKKSDQMRNEPGQITHALCDEPEVLALPFYNHACNTVLNSGGNILSDASANDVKSQGMASIFHSESSLKSEDSAHLLHIGRKGLENETSDTPSLSPSNTGSTGYSSSGSDDGHLTSSCSSRLSLYGFSSNGRSSVDSGLGPSISDHLCVAADVSHARQQLGDDWPEGQRVTDGRFCTDHPDKQQNLYCASCLRLICSLCFAAHHMDCAAVLTPDRACRALRWQLVKLESSVDTQISDLEARARALRDLLDSSARSAARTKDALNEHFQNLLVQLETRRRELMAEVDAGPRDIDRRGGRILHRLERGLLVLNYIRTFMKVLRQRDSAWELLATFDSSLSHLLTRVMQRTTASSNSIPKMLATPRTLSLDQCQLTALQVALDGLGLQKPGNLRDGQLGLDLESGSFIDSPASPECNGQSTSGGCPEDTIVDDVDEKLLGEVLSYLNRFPPPEPSWPGSGSGSTASNASSQHEDMDDEVFELTEGFSTSSNVDFESAKEHLPEDVPLGNYRLQQRLCPDFPQDEHRSFIIDIHLSETGQLVLLDAANYCLKRIDPRKPSFRPFWVHVHQPLSLCSAGWDRVLVSREGCALDLYSVGGEQVRLLANRNTRRQYVGLTRASDALVAAACPETHSVDLLDFSGRLLRSVMPISFHVGPKVVGATAAGELLVVHQPAKPPTTIFCFDMRGRVNWRHELRVRGRHVQCSKVMEGPDGDIIFALQEQSSLYSFSPKDGVTRALLTPEHGIKFPSGLARDKGGKLYVARTELQDKALALFTAEIDVYADLS